MLTSEAKFIPRTASFQPQPLSATCHSTQQKHLWIKADRFSSLPWLVIAAVGLLTTIFNLYTVQKILAQICTLCWQVSFTFGFVALIISLLLAQTYIVYRCEQMQSRINRWNILSSITIVIFAASLAMCIFLLPPIG